MHNIIERIIKYKEKSGSHRLYEEVIREVEKTLIIETLKHTKGNQTQAAKLLGISRPTLKDKIEKLNIKKDISISEG